MSSSTSYEGDLPKVLIGDLDAGSYGLLSEAGRIACDIETTGLNWRKDHIATFQAASETETVVVQLAAQVRPHRLALLIESQKVVKIYHHAPFDLRFVSHHWGVQPAAVLCTKIAARLAEPNLSNTAYSLKPTLERVLGVVIDKGEQRSDWGAASLSSAQLRYAADDVRYLGALWDALYGQVRGLGHEGLLQDAMAFLPSQVRLEIMGFKDIYAH